MAAWHRFRAMTGASTVRSRRGAASRNAWRRVRDFPSECGGLHTAVRIIARRPAKRSLRDIGWPSVTVARLTPRSLSPCPRRCPLCSANASTVSRRTSLRTRSHAMSGRAGYGSTDSCLNGSEVQTDGGKAWLITGTKPAVASLSKIKPSSGQLAAPGVFDIFRYATPAA